MGTKTGISWTDATWNPIRGCSRVSEGCRHCYAESVAHRFSGAGLAYEGLVQLDATGKSTGKWNGKIKFVEEHLLDPLRWKKPRRIFVNSMSDLFHENVTDEMRDRIFAVMALCPHHTFQVLTKRPERMLAYLTGACGRIADLVVKMRKERNDHGCVGQLPHIAPGAAWWPLANVQLGVSVEDQKTADVRVVFLLQTPAAVRFISAEPLLGPVDLENLPSFSGVGRHLDSLSNAGCEGADISARVDWVIVGGESGPSARPMHPDWARSLRDQCKAAGVPFFFKQWGEWAPLRNHPDARGPLDNVCFWDKEARCFEFGIRTFAFHSVRVGTKAAGCFLDGVEHHEFPAVTA